MIYLKLHLVNEDMLNNEINAIVQQIIIDHQANSYILIIIL